MTVLPLFSHSVMFDSVTPWTAARQASLSFTVSQSLLRLMSMESVLTLTVSSFPSIVVFSSELALRIRWPKYWSFSFSISPSNEYSELISFSIDWFDLLAAPGTLKSLLQQHSSKVSVLWSSTFFMIQFTSTRDYWTNRICDHTLSAKRCFCFLIHCLGLS